MTVKILGENGRTALITVSAVESNSKLRRNLTTLFDRIMSHVPGSRESRGPEQPQTCDCYLDAYST